MVVFLCAILAHVSSLGNQYVSWDDTIFAPSANGIAVAAGASEQVLGAGSTQGLAFYPVFRASMRLDLLLWDGKPLGAHALNLVLFGGVCVLAFLALRQLEGIGARAAFLGALLLAVHPVASESVAWVSGRKVLLATGFALASFLCWVNAAGRPLRRIASLVLFALACLSNAAVVALPVAVVAYEAICRRRGVWKAALDCTDFFLIAFAAGAARAFMVPRGGAGPGAVGLVDGVVRSAGGLWYALVRLVLPFHLANTYSYHGGGEGLAAVACVTLLLLLSCSIVLRRRGNSGVRFAIVWVWCMALPVLAHHAGPGERHMLLPGIGVLVLAGLGMRKVWTRAVGKVALVVVLCALGVMSHVQDRVWRDSSTLWARAVRVSPASLVAQKQLGSAMVRCGRRHEALAHYDRVLGVSKGDASLHYNLATLYAQDGNDALAVVHLRTAVKLDPKLAVAWNNLGQALERVGLQDEAMDSYKRAIDLNPKLELPRRNLANAHYALGNAFASNQQMAEAIREYQSALVVMPTHLGARMNLGNALAGTGHPAEAVKHFREAVRIAPEFADAYFNLSVALGELRRWREAIDVLDAGVRATGSEVLRVRRNRLLHGVPHPPSRPR